jgi:hypothetical protein
MTEETKERFNAKQAIENIDAQLDAFELVIDANIKAIDDIRERQEMIVSMLHKMSSALGLPKSILPDLKEVG